MMSTLKAAVALCVLLSIAQAIPTQPLREITSVSSDHETGASKTTIAVIIGLGLTTFFVVFLGFFMVRGYRNMRQVELVDDIQPNVKVVDHAAAKENLGCLPETK